LNAFEDIIDNDAVFAQITQIDEILGIILYADDSAANSSGGRL
jgi:hypothetical protein